MVLEVTHMMFTCQNLTVFVFLFFVVLAFLAASLAGQEVTTTADQRFAGGCGWWVWGQLKFLRIFGSQINAQDEKATLISSWVFHLWLPRLRLGKDLWFVMKCLSCDMIWYENVFLKLPQCCEKVCDVGIWRCQVRHSFDYFGVGCNVEIGNIHFMCLCVFASVLQISQ